MIADKKKNKMVLVKVSDMDKSERRAAIKNALRSLLEEPEDQDAEKENKPPAKRPVAKKRRKASKKNHPGD
jgi:hypothetical protein